MRADVVAERGFFGYHLAMDLGDEKNRPLNVLDMEEARPRIQRRRTLRKVGFYAAAILLSAGGVLGSHYSGGFNPPAGTRTRSWHIPAVPTNSKYNVDRGFRLPGTP